MSRYISLPLYNQLIVRVLCTQRQVTLCANVLVLSPNMLFFPKPN